MTLGHETRGKFFEHWFLKIVRSNQTWRVVESFSGESYCLERLALSKAYRVAEVCRALGCSSRYLYILFTRDIGLSPKHWMKLERMVVARRKLEGGKSPEDVAKDLGFMSVHTFCRQFQRFYHTTPDVFQRDRKTFDQFAGEKSGHE
jgi:AraC-like DNA-binding protein